MDSEELIGLFAFGVLAGVVVFMVAAFAL